MTIFGYSAPKSDIVALDAIREAFLVFNKGNSINDISNFKQITFINPNENIVDNFKNIISKTGVSFTETMNDYIQRKDDFYCQSQTFLNTCVFAYTHIEYEAEFASQWPKTISENTTWNELKEIIEYNTSDKTWFPISNK